MDNAKSIDYLRIIMNIYSVAELCTLASRYINYTGVRASRLSIQAAHHNRLFEKLLSGYDCRMEFGERASRWFDANWPEDVPWPENIKRISRPKKTRVPAYATAVPGGRATSEFRQGA